MRPTNLAATAAKMVLGLGLGLCLAAMPAWAAEPEPIDVLFVYPRQYELPAAPGSLVYSMYKGDFGGLSSLVSPDAPQGDAKAAPPPAEDHSSAAWPACGLIAGLAQKSKDMP